MLASSYTYYGGQNPPFPVRVSYSGRYVSVSSYHNGPVMIILPLVAPPWRRRSGAEAQWIKRVAGSAPWSWST